MATIADPNSPQPANTDDLVKLANHFRGMAFKANAQLVDYVGDLTRRSPLDTSHINELAALANAAHNAADAIETYRVALAFVRSPNNPDLAEESPS